MSLRGELQSITPDEAQWALLSILEQMGAAIQSGQAEETLEARSQMIETQYPGFVSLSNLVLERIASVESMGTHSPEEITALQAQFMVFALVQVAEMRDDS